jgi:uncharacterized protein YndB with AHSA1/START domain
MKWVKIVLGAFLALIVLCAAALAVAGMGPDANRMQSSVVIRNKPEAVWPWLYKADKVKRWVSWLIEVREEREGEPAPGGKAVWVMEDRNNGNARMEITGTVDAVEPNRRIAIHMTSPEGFSGTNVYTLTPLPDGSTRLDSDSRYTLDNGFARFMMPLVLWQARKKMAADMDNLRTLVEGARQ